MKYKMKQKQIQRITRITEKTLIVGADIANKIHVAREVDFRGIELGKDYVFHNDQEGLTKLASLMKELGQAHEKTDIVFGIEPNGHYWFPLAVFLKEQGIKIVVVNPHHVNKSKELEDNSLRATIRMRRSLPTSFGTGSIQSPTYRLWKCRTAHSDEFSREDHGEFESSESSNRKLV